MRRKILYFLGGALLVGGIIGITYAATLQGFQGGTGFATTTASNVGNFLQVASTSPWLTYTFVSSTAGGSGSVTTSSPITQFNFPYWASTSGRLNGTSTLLYSASGNTQLLQNGAFNASGTITQNGIGIVLNTRNVNTTSPLTGGGALSSDLTIACAACSTGSPATTTINAFTGTIFDIIAGSGLSRSIVNGSTTFYGVATSTSQRWTANQDFAAYASTTQLYSASTTFSNITSALISANSVGSLSAYGGAAACAWGNAITTLSAVGGSTCVPFGSLTTSTPYAANGLLYANAANTGVTNASGTLGFSVIAGNAVFQNTSITSSSQLYANSSTLATATGTTWGVNTLNASTINVTTCNGCPAGGGGSSTSSVQWSALNSIVGNGATSTPQIIFRAPSTIKDVWVANTSAVTSTFMIGLTTSTANPTSTWRNLFTTNQTILSTTSTQLTANGSTTIKAGDMLGYYFLPATVDCTGGTITYSGGNTIHTFNSSGTLSCASAETASVLVVGGGGGGGGTAANDGTGGAGGAGGVASSTSFSVSSTISVVVGNGGSGAVGETTAATKGGNSTFDVMTGTGGGQGGTKNNGAGGGTGGSGGGGAGTTANGGGTGTAGQGFAGGAGSATASDYGAGGGGGAVAVGADGTGTAGGNGGNGTASSISGSSVTYAGGGGGGVFGAGTAGTGGTGGGGNAGTNTGGSGANGTDNLGGGGGGASGNATTAFNGGNGGKGVVIVSYTSGQSGTVTTLFTVYYTSI